MSLQNPIKLLMVEDSLTLSAVYESYLEDERYELILAEDLASAREQWKIHQPDLVLLDVELPDGNGLELLDSSPEQKVAADVIVMTAYGSSEAAVQAVSKGAVDYLSKPFDADRLRVTIANAVKNRNLRDHVDAYASMERTHYCDFIGSSLPMQSIYRIIDSVAPSTATAFVVGESGTGKELTAAAIHNMSSRSGRQFHTINCGAIPAELIESELFGHVKGAFTGASGTRDGAASIADGGTLFLDEICEMDLELQKKLLRFVQTGEYQRVGGNKIEIADIRFVCATNRDPLDEVRAGRFREDLFYRLHVVPVHLPPLRERGVDIVTIANHLLEKHNGLAGKGFKAISASAKKELLSHRWPGNVRELENVIQQAVVLNDGSEITSEMLNLSVWPVDQIKSKPGQISVDGTTHSSGLSEHNQARMQIEPLWSVEKRTIQEAIEVCDGNVNKAAGLLEVAPSTIYRKLQTWERAQPNQEEDQRCTA
jgi:DNA-binding NtrC family response regulator